MLYCLLADDNHKTVAITRRMWGYLKLMGSFITFIFCLVSKVFARQRAEIFFQFFAVENDQFYVSYCITVKLKGQKG